LLDEALELLLELELLVLLEELLDETLEELLDELEATLLLEDEFDVDELLEALELDEAVELTELLDALDVLDVLDELIDSLLLEAPPIDGADELPPPPHAANAAHITIAVSGL